MTLPNIFDITVVRDQHRLLLVEFESGGPIAIDASSVERADGSALQLLTVAAVEARRQRRAFAISNPSTAFLTVARTLGLDSLLGITSH